MGIYVRKEERKKEKRNNIAKTRLASSCPVWRVVESLRRRPFTYSLAPMVHSRQVIRGLYYACVYGAIRTLCVRLLLLSFVFFFFFFLSLLLFLSLA